MGPQHAAAAIDEQTVPKTAGSRTGGSRTGDSKTGHA